MTRWIVSAALMGALLRLLADPSPARLRIPLWADGVQQAEPLSLKVHVNGQEARLVHLLGPEDDLMVLLILDLVGDLNEITLAKEALIEQFQQLPDNVYVGLLRAQDGMQVVLDPTRDRKGLIEAIQAYRIRGAPALLETIDTATQLADHILTKAPVRIALFYITDSNVYGYREDLTNPVINWSDQRDLSRRFNEGFIRERIARLHQKLSTRQVPVFIVHLEYQTDRLNEAYQNGLMQLASATGGRALFCRSNTDIATAIQETFGRIRSMYVAEIELGSLPQGLIELDIKSPSGSLQYRDKLLAIKR